MPECLECGKVFAKIHKRQVTCSPECSLARKKRIVRLRVKEWYAAHRTEVLLKSKKPPVFLLCKNPNCGKQFQRKGPTQKFCCHSCQAKHRRKINPEWYREAYKRHGDKSRARCMKNYRRTREKTPWKPLLEMAKARGRKKGTPCDIDNAWASARWTSRCEITGIPFELGRARRGLFSPSIDQIDAGKGYTKDNARFVLWAINSFKHEGTDEEMMYIARAIVTAHDAQKDLSPVAAFLSLPT